MPPSLKAKITAARRRWRSLQAAGGLLAALAALVVLVLVAFYSDRLLVHSGAGRQNWQWALLAAIVVLPLVSMLLPLLRPLTDETLAAHVERRFPDLNERLLTTIELARAGAGAGVSFSMIGQLARETERMAQGINFAGAMPLAPLARPAVFASVATVLLIGHLLVAPAAMGTWLRRILDPSADIPVYARTLLRVLPGDRVLPRGASVTLGIQAEGRLPERATLHYKPVGSDRWTEVELAKPATVRTARGETLRKFTFTLQGAQQSLRYFATANDGRSNPHTIRVEDRPAILGVRLGLRYPAYTGRPPQTLAATAGNIVAPVGTRVEVTATANKPLRRALFVRDGKTGAPWRVSGATASGRLTVLRDGTYGLRLRDTTGFDAAETPQYTIHAQPDQPPAVQIVAPAADVERTPEGVVNLRITARDDWGVRDTRLAYRIGGKHGTLALPGGANRPVVNTGGAWNLAALPLRPGDTVTYEAVARDAVPQTGRSAAYRVRILSAGEMRDRIEAEVNEERESLRRLIAGQQAARAELARGDAQAQATERRLAGETADLARRMARTTQQMRDNNLGAPAEQARRDAAEQTLRQLGNQRMPRAADAIERGARAAAAGQEQEIQRTLERVAGETGRAPDAAALAARADQLALQQQRLAEQTDLARAEMGEKTAAQMSRPERDRLSALARQQAALRAQSAALRRQVAQAARDARERGNPAAQALQRAAEQADPTQNQARAQQELQSGNPAEASPRQSEAARDLQNLADQLSRAADRTPDTAAMQRRAEQLHRLADRLEKLAQEQNDIRRENRNAAESEQPDPATGRRLAEREQSLRAGVRQIAPGLNDVPEAQKAAGRAAEQLGEAAQRMSRSALEEARDPAIQAQRRLEQAAREARSAAEAREQAASLNKMRQEAEQLARDQRAARRQTRQLEVERRRGLSAPAQQIRADALRQTQSDLAARSRALREQMPSEAYRWAAGEATERMERAESGLQRADPGPATQRSQEQAAQTLERIARTLGQQARAQSQSQQMQNSPQQAQAAQEMAEAGSELQLAREMQAQIRQETADLEQRRRRAPNRALSEQQRSELSRLESAQRETENIARGAARRLRSLPEAGRAVERAGEEMQSAQGMLQQEETGAPTQGRQQTAVRLLDQAASRVRQAQQQMQQQQMAGGQQSQQQQMAQQRGGQDGLGRTEPRGRTPISPLRNSAPTDARPGGGSFGGLDPRGQRALQEGRGERVPAEYRDLVNQYYKALSR